MYWQGVDLKLFMNLKNEHKQRNLKNTSKASIITLSSMNGNCEKLSWKVKRIRRWAVIYLLENVYFIWYKLL